MEILNDYRSLVLNNMLATMTVLTHFLNVSAH